MAGFGDLATGKMLGTGIQLHGTKELLAALDEFRGSVARRVVKRAVTVAAKPVLRAIKDRAKESKQSGTLWKSIGSVIRAYPKGVGSVVPGQKTGRMARAPTFLAYIGPRKGFDRNVHISRTKRGKQTHRIIKKAVTGGRIEYRRPTKYAHLVERGTTHSRPIPFMRPGWDQSRNAAMQALTAELRAGIAKEAAKAANKTKRAR